MAEMLVVQEIGIEVFPCTQRLLDEAASMADLPIKVTSCQGGLPASFQHACNGKGHHEIHVDASFAGLVGVERANYYLSHEAAHAIRALSVPPDQRRGTVLQQEEEAEDSEKALLALAAESVARGKYAENQEVFEAFVEWENTMLGALGIPEEIEVDRYVLQQCPELRNAFGIHLCGMNAKFESLFKEEGKPKAELVWWEPLDSMWLATCCCVLWVEGRWMGQKLIKPFYRRPDILEMGRKLLAIVEAKEPGHLGDMKAEEQFIETLGLAGIFKVVPIKDIADPDESPPDGEPVVDG